MKRVLLFLVAVIALSGCAALDEKERREANERYDKMMNSYLGARESSLVDAWGPPDREYETDEAKYLTYLDSRVVPIPAPTPMRVGNAPQWGMYGGSATFFCKNVFKIRNGIVVQIRFNGNACKA